MYPDSLTKTVAEQAGLDPGDAERAIEATLVTLAERISEGEAEHLARRLPDDKARLLRGGGDAQAFGADEFLRRVADREDADPATAERHARTVVTAMAPHERRKEMHDMASQLPHDLRERLLPGVSI